MRSSRSLAGFLTAIASLAVLASCGCGGGSTGDQAEAGTGPAPVACGSTPEHVGDGTYYDATGGGNCSFDPTGDLMVGAMNHTDYANSAACGACAHIVGPSGEATVRIVDQCPECKAGDIDLSPLAFSKLAALDLGRVRIRWTYVPCTVSGPIQYHFKEGSSEWWLAVQIRNARYAIAKLEARKGGVYVPLERASYNYFIAASGLGKGPYDFRVTDVEGNVLEDLGVPLREAQSTDGKQQFAACTR